MPESRRVVAVVAPAAQQDIRDISRWSEVNFGQAAARRYRELLVQALRDLEADPVRPGSRERTDLLAAGVRTYHLALSRERAGRGRPGVRKPRHYLLYRSVTAGVIEIGRILHDSSDLRRHLPEGYRAEVDR